jgi:hypothetical protein
MKFSNKLISGKLGLLAVSGICISGLYAGSPAGKSVLRRNLISF